MEQKPEGWYEAHENRYNEIQHLRATNAMLVEALEACETTLSRLEQGGLPPISFRKLIGNTRAALAKAREG
jgi:hypothetical protein